MNCVADVLLAGMSYVVVVDRCMDTCMFCGKVTAQQTLIHGHAETSNLIKR